MVRSFTKKKRLNYFFLILLCFFNFSSISLAEEKSKKPIMTKKQSPILKMEFAASGTFIGIISDIQLEKKYIIVKPLMQTTEKNFYFDKETSIQKAGKKIKIEDLQVPEKVKILYLRQDKTYLANSITVGDNFVIPTPLPSKQEEEKPKPRNPEKLDIKDLL